MALPRYTAQGDDPGDELLEAIVPPKVQSTGMPGGAEDADEGTLGLIKQPGVVSSTGVDRTTVGPVALSASGEETDIPKRADPSFLSGTAPIDTAPQGGIITPPSVGNENPAGPPSGGPAYNPWAHPAISKYQNTDPSTRPVGVYPDAVVQAAPPRMPGMPDPTDQRFAPDGRPIIWLTGDQAQNNVKGGATTVDSTTAQPGSVAKPADTGAGSGATGFTGSEGGSAQPVPGSGTTTSPGTAGTVTPPAVTSTGAVDYTKTVSDALAAFSAGTTDITGFMKSLGAVFGDGKPIGINGQPGASLSETDQNALMDAGITLGDAAWQGFLKNNGGKLPIRKVPSKPIMQEYTDVLTGEKKQTPTGEMSPEAWVFVNPFTGQPIKNGEEYVDASGAASAWEAEQGLRESYLDLQKSIAEGAVGAQFNAQLAVLQDKLQAAREGKAFENQQALQTGQQTFESEQARLTREQQTKLQEDQQGFLSSEAEKERAAAEKEAAAQREWTSKMEEVKHGWDTEMQQTQLKYQDSWQKMQSEIANGNLTLAREQFEQAKAQEQVMNDLRQRESTLQIFSLLGQYPHLRGMLQSSGVLNGINIGTTNLGAIFGGTPQIPANALPNLTQLTQMPAAQRDSLLNDLAGQYGVPVDQIMQMIQRNTTGGTRRLA